ncbi:hypothetical protein JL37_25840 [Achromobacter sp. RTa]|nr:hypothetical protein JL37_25840 [Achromobacter sp. RTa]
MQRQCTYELTKLLYPNLSPITFHLDTELLAVRIEAEDIEATIMRSGRDMNITPKRPKYTSDYVFQYVWVDEKSLVISRR